MRCHDECEGGQMATPVGSFNKQESYLQGRRGIETTRQTIQGKLERKLLIAQARVPMDVGK